MFPNQTADFDVTGFSSSAAADTVSVEMSITND
jgi:hypothetical protein